MWTIDTKSSLVDLLTETNCHYIFSAQKNLLGYNAYYIPTRDKHFIDINLNIFKKCVLVQ